MRQKEFGIFKEIIEKHQPLRCLEWGAGYSTLYFSKLLPLAAPSGTQRHPAAVWHAVEHDSDWANRLIRMNQDPIVHIHQIPPNNPLWSGDGSREDFEQYLNYPQQYAPFDLVIIDGRSRKACLKTAHSLLSDRGVVILHDANRAAYHEGFSRYKYGKLFKDYHLGNGGVWVGSNNVPLEEVLNVASQEQLWNAYERLVGWMH